MFDFGCGCGREARQLMQQQVSPKEYRGVDLHLGMIRWCQSNLTTRAPQFTFEHHDVFNLGFNPGEKSLTLPLPGADSHFTLVNVDSVFTDLIQSQTEHYLREARRIMRDDGVFRSTWFFFDRTDFPMLQDSQAAIYTTEPDLTGAVIYDRDRAVERTRGLGLIVTHVIPPHIRGFQWNVLMRPTNPGIVETPFPEDTAAEGSPSRTRPHDRSEPDRTVTGAVPAGRSRPDPLGLRPLRNPHVLASRTTRHHSHWAMTSSRRPAPRQPARMRLSPDQRFRPSRSSAARIWLSHSVPSWRPFGSWSSRSQRHAATMARTRIRHSLSSS